ncbi:DNA-binding transcriptional regulator, MarR family [Abditibacterium utsteinense]|uniref:DNA-binding transcriptional regulator, MarR family n=1 Tax=Abditibacterium utsteinense TaxID=1960156 RepID=A0A2S8SRV6_9BACT|nr:MarR family transcriptional regulator [Abditibacterium utsteinense]PQV63530.1 DNA-binding transcriptional regulator, MarR family [Abditibacterium utsteinense]
MRNEADDNSSIIPPVLSRWTATLLSRAAQKMREGFEARVSDLGLRSKHYGALVLLQNGPLTQVEISRSLWVDRTTMVALIDDLTRLELVQRQRHPEDRRAHAVTLTPKGFEVLKLATQAVDATEAECFAPLSVHEREQLRALLQKLL